MKKSVIWGIWLIMTATIGGYYGYRVFASRDKQELLIGKTSYGHFQIETACSACHTSAFGGIDELQKACVRCHGEELERADNSHPKSKFTDPRNAERLEFLDARFCVTCHVEHQGGQNACDGSHPARRFLLVLPSRHRRGPTKS